MAVTEEADMAAEVMAMTIMMAVTEEEDTAEVETGIVIAVDIEAGADVGALEDSSIRGCFCVWDIHGG